MVKKQTLIKTVSFLSALVLVLGGFLIKEKDKSRYYNTVIENQYSKAFEQLNSSLNNISMAMEKTLYVNSAKKMSVLSAEIFSEAELAKTALSELSMQEGSLDTIYRFLSQVGNYAMSVAKSITNENGVSDRQRNELKALSDTAKIVSNVINDSAVEYNTHKHWVQTIENKLNNAVSKDSLAISLTELEEDMSDYPTLIYDGPYSDHILQKQPLMTSNAKEFSQENALKTAIQFSNDETIKFEEMMEGKIEAYRFSNDNVTIAVSKMGGYVTFMRKNRMVGESLLTYDKAIMKAEKFLSDMKISNMIDTYYFTDDGVCVINFAYLDGYTICYTDLIKVGVAMDTGEIMLLETTGYLTNHTARAFIKPKFTDTQAAEKISSDLQIEESRMVLIPTDAGGEVRCYEFLCLGEDNREILIYLNTQTLEEEQIYILLKSDGGTLVK
ncbi:MAG: germination protein YpeB [Clostridia bacterium]|nr:germination protein YpeB [Clostridia bacterium]